MSASKKTRAAVRKRGKVFEPAVKKQVVGLTPQERLALARVYERWARQLRRSVEDEVALVRTFIDGLSEELIRGN